jgi:hypothetical protein
MMSEHILMRFERIRRLERILLSRLEVALATGENVELARSDLRDFYDVVL